MKLKLLSLYMALLAAMTGVAGCTEVDDDRVPYYPVYIDLSTPGYWERYGVHALGQSREFIKSRRVPADFSYVVTSETGFGGVLLVTDVENYPLAYDLACPVELNRETRVVFDSETLRARCPKCGSEYDVCELNGTPVSGEAFKRKWALRRYQAVPVGLGGSLTGYRITQR